MPTRECTHIESTSSQNNTLIKSKTYLEIRWIVLNRWEINVKNTKALLFYWQLLLLGVLSFSKCRNQNLLIGKFDFCF